MMLPPTFSVEIKIVVRFRFSGERKGGRPDAGGPKHLHEAWENLEKLTTLFMSSKRKFPG
jgi:hypothetical protein